VLALASIFSTTLRAILIPRLVGCPRHISEFTVFMVLS
jgi:hypothetical protein